MTTAASMEADVTDEYWSEMKDPHPIAAPACLDSMHRPGPIIVLYAPFSSHTASVTDQGWQTPFLKTPKTRSLKLQLQSCNIFSL